MRRTFYILAIFTLCAGCGNVGPNNQVEKAPVPQTHKAARIGESKTKIVETATATTNVVITQEDEDAIRRILSDFLQHIRKPEVSFRSDLTPYLNCNARRELLKYSWKAVPYLIEHVVRNWNVHPYLGSALVEDENVHTPEEVWKWNVKRKNEVMVAVLPNFVIDAVLRELPSGKAAPEINKPENRRGGYHYCELYAWVKWWKQHKDRFEFRTEKPLLIPDPMYEFDFVYGIRVDVHNGVFDVFALSDSYRNIIRKVADVLKIELTFGNQVYIDIIATVDMKSVTFEEFLYMAGRTVCVKGFTYEKTGNSYWIGNWINREK